MLVNRQKITKLSTSFLQMKLRLKEKVRNQMVFRFNSKTELAEILGLIKHFEYSKLSQLTQRQRENSDGSDIDKF